ncbi:glycosyltransferase family 2 protein [Leptothermofonsia sichuanensis E412]|uniref:glycosyltransferase family 2 protein n=1 Tax=Leptothermofonsia sichuanensis TaxID=2917832 RepID=UPI001CA74FB2|nr:glycosyltransferase family 2 protein [Leptothermofonsia sichuanensis]QZZ18813.1 glycosyltransferase family 2 protein [Leptothermofonsia sichuanensis E412]
MSQIPLISVIMPVYNAERYVGQAIDSILAQTLDDFEFLIADDGSTDHSLSVLQTYAERDQRIRLSCHSNQGVSRTRNQMLQQARGEFIAVMDADDIALPDRFALQVDFLRQHPAVVCVGGSHHLIDEAGRLLTFLDLPQTDEAIQKAALAGHGSICHPSAMIRRYALEKVGGYDEAYHSAHDLDLWLKLGEVGQLANLSQAVLQYRLHPHSVSGRNPIAQRLEARQACEHAWQRRGIEGQFEAEDTWRPAGDRASRHHFMLQYGWWAFNSHQRQTALLYGWRAIKALPLSLEGWRLLVCAAVKPLPDKGFPSSEGYPDPDP